MLNAIIGFAIKNKLIIGLMVLALIAFGGYSVSQLPIDAVPDITNNQVQVITVAPSFGATDIERLVTFPIEQATSNLPGLKEMRSFSRFGLSLVTIVFDDNVDIYLARQQVSEKLQQVRGQIPAGIGTPELGPVTTGLGEIYQYTLRAKKGYEQHYTETELRTIQDWIVRRQLLSVKGVAEVSSFGGKLKQYSIEVAPNRLQSFHITIGDVFHALEQNNQNTGGAYIEKNGSVLYIRSEGLLGDTNQIKTIPIKQLPDGTPILLKDVADVRIGYATRYGALTYNDEGEVAGAIVMMLKGANSGQVIKAVKAKIAQIKKSLPEGVVIEPFLDRTKMVNNAINTVEKNLIEGALIVVFVLVLFLGNFRAGLLVASVIPLAMLFAVIMMNLFGVSGNLMSLGALDFGLIVDGAVIIVEAVLHQLSHSQKLGSAIRWTPTEMDHEVKKSAGKMMNSAVFGQLIILVVYLPIFTLEGIEGKMFRPMAQTVAFALLGAFLLSITYIPMMSAVVLSNKKAPQINISDKIMSWLAARYQAVLSRALRAPGLLLSATVGLFLLSVFILSTLGGEFIPTLEEGDFAVETRVLAGSSLTTSIESTQKLAHILLTRFPEVEQVVTKIGSGEVPTDPMPMEAADMMIILKDKKAWTSAHTYNDLAAKMTEAVAEVPGVTTSFQYPVQMRFNELMTGARQDVVCKIFGENLDTLAYYAAELGKIVNTVKGAKNLYVEQVAGLPQIVINYNRAAVAQYGLNIEDINRTVNAAFAGQVSGAVYEGEKRFDVVVRLAGTHKQDIADVQHLLIATPTGTQVPLNQVAEVSVQEGPYQVQREEAKRRITVGFNVRDRDVQSVVQELQNKVEQRQKLPPGYYVTYGGVFENLVAAKQRLMIAVPVSLILIFILLFFAFKSMRNALLIYTAIPLSAMGGIFALAGRGMPFSISAGIGFIALFGVAVLNGIVLVAEFNRLKKQGTADLRSIILTGANSRLRPVLMTALVASLGFLPMALSNGAGAEVQRPLATVVIGGLLLATLLTLFVLPMLYLLVEQRALRIQARSAAALLLPLLLVASPTRAQQPIGLEAAIDSALHNNLRLKNEQLKARYHEVLARAGAPKPHTAFSSEVGQFNSAYIDTRVSVSQAFSFPTVYSRQRQVLQEEWKAAALETNIAAAQLKRQVAQVFYEYLYLQSKIDLLLQADTLYATYADRAALRLEKGESNVLEKATAATQLGQLRQQLAAAEQDRDAVLLQFRLLVNTRGNWVPSGELPKLAIPITVIDGARLQHPTIAWLQQQQILSEASLRQQRTLLLPEAAVSYSNSSIRGIGADERFYTAGNRFHAAQVGIALPVFRRAQKATIAGAALQVDMAKIAYDAGLMQWQAGYATALAQQERCKRALRYYETEALANAALIATTANLQRDNGEINYLAWAQLMQQALSVRSDYIEAVKTYNQSAIELQYYNQ